MSILYCYWNHWLHGEKYRIFLHSQTKLTWFIDIHISSDKSDTKNIILLHSCRWNLTCIYKDNLNVSHHRGHFITHSKLEWLLSCVSSYELLQINGLWKWVLTDSHSVHLNGFSPVYVSLHVFVETSSLSKWFLTLCTFEWLLSCMSPHVLLLTVLDFMCSFRKPVCINDLSHSVNLNSFSPVWILQMMSFMCFLRYHDQIVNHENDLSHSVYLNGFSLVWVLVCFFKFSACANYFSPSVHLNGFSLACTIMIIMPEGA